MIKIAHILAKEEWEPRSFKFVKSLEKSGFDVQKILKKPNERYIKFMMRAVKELRKKRPDIIHAHRISGLIPALLAKISGLKSKIIYDKHDIHKYDIFFDNILFLVDFVIVASDKHKKRMQKKHKNVEVIHNYSWFKKIDDRKINLLRKKIGLKNDDIVILFQGSIVPEYGLHMLLNATRDLSEKIKILIIGWIKDEKYWERCKKMFDKRIIYLGVKKYEEMEKYINIADIGVVLFQKNRLTEYGNPNKLFEFFACRVPVIVTDIPSISKYIKNGKNGFIIKDVNDLKRVIELLSKKEIRKKIIRNIPSLRWDDEFEKYIKIIKTLANKRQK